MCWSSVPAEPDVHQLMPAADRQHGDVASSAARRYASLHARRVRGAVSFTFTCRSARYDDGIDIDAAGEHQRIERRRKLGDAAGAASSRSTIVAAGLAARATSSGRAASRRDVFPAGDTDRGASSMSLAYPCAEFSQRYADRSVREADALSASPARGVERSTRRTRRRRRPLRARHRTDVHLARLVSASASSSVSSHSSVSSVTSSSSSRSERTMLSLV